MSADSEDDSVDQRDGEHEADEDHDEAHEPPLGAVVAEERVLEEEADYGDPDDQDEKVSRDGVGFHGLRASHSAALGHEFRFAVLESPNGLAGEADGRIVPALWRDGLLTAERAHGKFVLAKPLSGIGRNRRAHT